MNGSLARLRYLVVFFVLALIMAFYASTFRAGHRWGDDFAQYIHHARNLMEGRPYIDVGLIENPAVNNLSPRYYPPGYPALIALISPFRGVNYYALKVEIALLLITALWFIYVLARDRLGDGQALAVMLLVGMNPVIWGMRNDAISDIPFLAAAYGSLCMIDFVYRRYKGTPPAGLGAIVGLSIYVAFAMRPLGLLLVPALLCFDAAGRRSRPGLLRPSAFSLVAAVVSAACMIAQRGILGSDGRLSLFRLTPSWLLSSVVKNFLALGPFFHNAWSAPIYKALFALGLALIVYGILAQLRAGARVYDFFLVFYLATMIPYPYPDTRYLIPVFPILTIYLVAGFAGLRRLLPTYAARSLAAAGLVIVGACYASEYASAERGPIREGIGDPEFVELCNYARANTPGNARFIARKPRLFSLLTGRAAGVYRPLAPPEAVMTFIRSVHVQYVVVGDPPASDYDADVLTLDPFVNRFHDQLTLLYHSAHYCVFRLH